MATPLVRAEDIHSATDPGQRLFIDCRHRLAEPDYGRRAYRAGHLPGAIFLHLDDDLSGPQWAADGRFRGRHPLPDRRTLARKLAAAGMTATTTLIAYDDDDSMFAARMWWLALWLGHRRVHVLDGGIAAWMAAGGSLSTDTPHVSLGVAMPPDEPSLVTAVDADVVLGNLGSQRYRVLDARGADRYRGEVEPLDARPGHIPGASNRPFRANLDEGNRFKSADELREEFRSALDGVLPGAVIHQCGSGVSACHNLLAMAVASLPIGHLYPGSWSEWSSDPAKPVTIGATP
ncbi:MAG: sulfurtransferase [Proteobacteria bacterium]|nr:sulfurtransferase [Pseudomonadota bacterium]